MNIIFLTQQFCKKFALALLVFFGQIFSASAISDTNVAEMITAFTTMALDIAHKHYTFKDDSRKAEVLGLLAATSSATNKGLFLYNNHKAQNGLDAWDPITKDCLVNSAWGARDLVSFAENLALISTRSMVNVNSTWGARDLIVAKHTALLSTHLTLNNAAIQNKRPESIEVPQDTDASLSKKPSTKSPASSKNTPFKFAYARDVIIFPVLKGLTSLAIACTQGYTTSYSGDRARFTATAAYSFVRLLEEYSSLAPDSKLSKPLIAAALVNLLWLGHETQGYIDEAVVVKGRSRQGACVQCGNGLQQKLRVLECGHARCNNCLQNTVRFHHPDQLHHVICREAGCNHHFSRNEIRGIVHNNPPMMRAYDVAAFHNAPFAPRLAKRAPAEEEQPALVPAEEEEEELVPELVRPPRPAFVAIDPAARAAFDANGRVGNCVLCLEDNVNLRVLGCNHAYCVDCLRGHVQAHAGGGEDDDGEAIDQLRCPDHRAGCVHHLNRNEIGCIIAPEEERRILDLFDNAAYNRAYPEARPADAAELAEIAAGNLQICPRCNQRVDRIDGCNHITCPCGHHFCWLCGIGWEAREGYAHFNPARCPTWGPRPGAPVLAPDADDDGDDAFVRPAPYAGAPRGGMFRIDLGDGNVFELDLDRDLPPDLFA